MITIVIVDDHAVVRQGLRFLLEQQEEMQVVGEGENGEQAIQLVADLLPDVLLLDLLMPRMDGVSAVRQIKSIAPTTRIIVLTSYFEDEQIFSVIKAGALSYLLKDMRAWEKFSNEKKGEKNSDSPDEEVKESANSDIPDAENDKHQGQ